MHACIRQIPHLSRRLAPSRSALILQPGTFECVSVSAQTRLKPFSGAIPYLRCHQCFMCQPYLLTGALQFCFVLLFCLSGVLCCKRRRAPLIITSPATLHLPTIGCARQRWFAGGLRRSDSGHMAVSFRSGHFHVPFDPDIIIYIEGDIYIYMTNFCAPGKRGHIPEIVYTDQRNIYIYMILLLQLYV